MYRLLENQKRKPSDIKKLLGYTTIIALFFQLLIPGLFGMGIAVAQEVPTSLTVTKVVEGGDMLAGDFELFVNSTSVTSGVALVFDPATLPTAPLTVSETLVEGYTPTFSGDCAVDGTVTLVEGEQLECVITNTFTEPPATTTATTSLTVTKIVEGGDMLAGDFELFVNSSPVISGVPMIFDPTTLPTAPLTVSETLVEDYTATFSGDCAVDGTVTLVAGEELECVITNTFIGDPATTTATTSLTVTKVVEGGDMLAGDFELFVNSTSVTSGVALVFDPLSLPLVPVTVSETPVDGYTATFSGDCAVDGTVTIVDGEELECVITNTFTGDPATTTATTTSLTVTKQVVGGDMDADDFPLFVNGMSIESGVASTTLAAGTYIISESGDADYTATFSGDCAANGSITLAEGDDLECVITNTFTGDPATTTTSPNVNVTVTGGNSSARSGDVTVILGATSTVPVAFPFFTSFPPGQVLGAQSFIPVQTPFVGQVLGAQSAVPGLPLTGGEQTTTEKGLPNVALVTLAGMLAMAGAGLILTPRSSALSSGKNRGK